MTRLKGASSVLTLSESYLNFLINLEDLNSPIKTDVIRKELKMKNVADDIIEERKAQYSEVMKQWIDHGKKDGIADVTASTDLHIRDILLINQINLSRKEKYTDWCSELPEGVTYVDGQRGNPFWDRIDQLLLNQKLFDENSYCHGFIIGVQEGWAEIKELVIGRYYERESEKYAERNPTLPPIPPVRTENSNEDIQVI
ncbi:MAG: hypothetical protein HN945_08640 [Deltaproteobacteria bacterium]|jgi:hypothetical protein|nr:hypothetical protein [Deltaproteobacteria bacterium]MBT7711262.1 hypothetical protein [Deltaproteobacteria bacterium]